MKRARAPRRPAKPQWRTQRRASGRSVPASRAEHIRPTPVAKGPALRLLLRLPLRAAGDVHALPRVAVVLRPVARAGGARRGVDAEAAVEPGVVAGDLCTRRSGRQVDPVAAVAVRHVPQHVERPGPGKLDAGAAVSHQAVVVERDIRVLGAHSGAAVEGDEVPCEDGGRLGQARPAQQVVCDHVADHVRLAADPDAEPRVVAPDQVELHEGRAAMVELDPDAVVLDQVALDRPIGSAAEEDAGASFDDDVVADHRACGETCRDAALDGPAVDHRTGCLIEDEDALHLVPREIEVDAVAGDDQRRALTAEHIGSECRVLGDRVSTHRRGGGRSDKKKQKNRGKRDQGADSGLSRDSFPWRCRRPL